jgi:hypothetical protein
MLFTTAYDQDLATATKDQVVKLLVGTGLFDHIEDEIVIWLNHLITSEEKRRPTILKYLEKVITTLLTTPQAYADQIAKVVQEAQQAETVMDVKATGSDAAQALILCKWKWRGQYIVQHLFEFARLIYLQYKVRGQV